MKLIKADITDLSTIWEILQDAIMQRKLDGSNQWQDGYPNEQTVMNGIQKGYAYVLSENSTIIAYAAISFDKKPAYNNIIGNWLSDGSYVVVHRVAIAKAFRGKGFATKLFELIEDLCAKNNVFSIKVDTNFDNVPMLKILKKLNYTYCGEVFQRGDSRRAYEKLL